MRLLAYLLLLANVCLLAWIFIRPPQQPPEYRPIPVPPGIEPLVLLSERNAHTTGDTSMAAFDEPVVDDDAEPVAGPAAEEGPPAPETESDIAPLTAAVDEPVEPVEELPEVQPEPAPERICRTVGPMLRKTVASRITKQLAAQGYKASLRAGETRQPAGYWVYMPAMPAREARRIVAELDANGMKDYFIGKQNYISLGIFSRKDKAQSRLDKIESLGFEAVLDQRYRTRTVYWLDLEERGNPLLGSPVWQQIQAKHTDIRVQTVSCE